MTLPTVSQSRPTRDPAREIPLTAMTPSSAREPTRGKPPACTRSAPSRTATNWAACHRYPPRRIRPHHTSLPEQARSPLRWLRSVTQATHYAYDALDQLVTVTDAARKHEHDRPRRPRPGNVDHRPRPGHPDPHVACRRHLEPRPTPTASTLDLRLRAAAPHQNQTADRREPQTPAGTRTATQRRKHPRASASATHASSPTHPGAAGADGQRPDRFWYDNLGRPTGSGTASTLICHEMGYTYDAPAASRTCATQNRATPTVNTSSTATIRPDTSPPSAATSPESSTTQPGSRPSRPTETA